jgi:hypothetical protein
MTAMKPPDLQKLLEPAPASPPRAFDLSAVMVEDLRSMAPGRVSQLVTAQGDLFAVLHWEDFVHLMDRAGLEVRRSPTPSSDG